jgi:hypothetical protein
VETRWVEIERDELEADGGRDGEGTMVAVDGWTDASRSRAGSYIHNGSGFRD